MMDALIGRENILHRARKIPNVFSIVMRALESLYFKTASSSPNDVPAYGYTSHVLRGEISSPSKKYGSFPSAEPGKLSSAGTLIMLFSNA